MASAVHFIEANPLPCVAARGRKDAEANSGPKLTALCIEFIARVPDAAQADVEIQEAIQNVLGAVPGFAGCMVLVADEERRLITAIAFWGGAHRVALSQKSVPWVNRALAPYVEHCLRACWFHTRTAADIAGGANFGGTVRGESRMNKT